MSSKKNKDELIFPTKEEMDKESEKFNDPNYGIQLVKNMLDERIAFNKKRGLSNESIQITDTIDSLWAIADDMRVRKEAGEFSTYMDAYRWAAKHITQNGKTIKAESLENEWHKAKYKGTVGLD
jgi:hypothetical protein